MGEIINFTYIRYKNKASEKYKGYVPYEKVMELNLLNKIEVIYFIIIGETDYIIERKFYFIKNNTQLIQSNTKYF